MFSDKHKKFEVQIPGSSLKAAIVKRISEEKERFEEQSEPDPNDPMDTIRAIEKRAAIDRLSTLSMVADNLVDDSSYPVTMDDLNELTVAHAPQASSLFNVLLKTFQGQISAFAGSSKLS